MSYTLGNITLPNPKTFSRDFVEISASNNTIKGETTRKVVNRKEVFTMTFQNLTPAEVNAILAEYELNLVRTFTVNEVGLEIGPTSVLIDIEPRSYPKRGPDYREDLSVKLTEVT